MTQSTSKDFVGQIWNGERNVKQYRFRIEVVRAWDDNRVIKWIEFESTMAEATARLAEVRAQYPKNIAGLKCPC